MIEIKCVSPDRTEEAIAFIWGQWGNEQNRAFFADCISHSYHPDGLPKFYLVYEGGSIIACYALLVNDLVSRQDLMPWLACVFVVPEHRKHGIGGRMLAHGVAEARRLGFDAVYLLTDHIGYYERYGWEYICDAYDVRHEKGRVYQHTV